MGRRCVAGVRGGVAGYALSWAVGTGGRWVAVAWRWQLHVEGLGLGQDPDRSGQEGEHSARMYMCTSSPPRPPSPS